MLKLQWNHVLIFINCWLMKWVYRTWFDNVRVRVSWWLYCVLDTFLRSILWSIIEEGIIGGEHSIYGKFVTLFNCYYEMLLSGMVHFWWRCLLELYECESTLELWIRPRRHIMWSIIVVMLFLLMWFMKLVMWSILEIMSKGTTWICEAFLSVKYDEWGCKHV